MAKKGKRKDESKKKDESTKKEGLSSVTADPKLGKTVKRVRPSTTSIRTMGGRGGIGRSRR